MSESDNINLFYIHTQLHTLHCKNVKI